VAEVPAPPPLAQLALSLDAPPDDTPDLLSRLRALPAGSLAARAADIAPLADRLRALADTLAARARDPRL
jgi:hypothetical protein